MSDTETPPDAMDQYEDLQLTVLAQRGKALEQFEQDLFKRFDDGATDRTVLSDHEARQAQELFNWTDIQQRRFVARCHAVWKNRQVAGTAKAREKLAKQVEKTQADHKELMTTIAEQRKKLDEQEKTATEKLKRLERQHFEASEAARLLRELLPEETLSRYNSRKSHLKRTLGQDLSEKKTDLAEVLNVLTPPMPAPEKPGLGEQRTYQLWLENVQRFNRKFVTVDRGRMALSSEYHSARPELMKLAETWQQSVDRMQAEYDAKMAEVEKLKDIYLD